MGIFKEELEVFTTYRATLQFRSWLAGGVPRSRDMIERWLRQHVGQTTATKEREALFAKTLEEMGIDVGSEFSTETLIEASQKVVKGTNTQGFKSNDELGLFVEGRQVKAMLKECANSQFGGDNKWGPTRKGPKGFIAEHVHIEPEQIAVGRVSPDEITLFIGHVTGPQGPRHTLTYTELVYQPEISFLVLFTARGIKQLITDKGGKALHTLWNFAEENGFGTMRAQGYGKFDVVGWEQLDVTPSFAIEPSLRRIELLHEAEAS